MSSIQDIYKPASFRGHCCLLELLALHSLNHGEMVCSKSYSAQKHTNASKRYHFSLVKVVITDTVGFNLTKLIVVKFKNQF